jgi:ribosomal protein S18 acetylase RimI-like enzyme
MWTIVEDITPALAAEAAALTAGAYWNDGIPLERMVRAHLGSTAWVGAIREGVLVGTARALSDGGKWAWIYDVFVVEADRGRGLGQQLVRRLLAHPAVEGALVIRLSTRDAVGLYRRFGFELTSELPKRPWVSIDMVRTRGLLPGMPGFEPR